MRLHKNMRTKKQAWSANLMRGWPHYHESMVNDIFAVDKKEEERLLAYEWISSRFANFSVLTSSISPQCNKFQFSSSTNTRGHAYKLYISQNSCNIRRKFLPRRILTEWNSLPAYTDFSSLAAFRRTVFSINLAKFLQCNDDKDHSLFLYLF